MDTPYLTSHICRLSVRHWFRQDPVELSGYDKVFTCWHSGVLRFVRLTFTMVSLLNWGCYRKHWAVSHTQSPCSHFVSLCDHFVCLWVHFISLVVVLQTFLEMLCLFVVVLVFCQLLFCVFAGTTCLFFCAPLWSFITRPIGYNILCLCTLCLFLFMLCLF